MFLYFPAHLPILALFESTENPVAHIKKQSIKLCLYCVVSSVS
jgi:hypothetical protein